MNMMAWRILADDLTGALDSAAAFTGAADSHEVPVGFGDTAPTAAKVQALSTGTRDEPHAAMASRLAATLPWFQSAASAAHFSFKKVDSLLRGNTFAEVAWWAQHGGFKGIVFAPALPAQGRFTRGGRHWVGPPRQPDVLACQPAASHPALTLLDAFAAAGLQAHLLAGPLHHLPETGGVIVPDVVTDDDLGKIAALSLGPDARQWLWCGSAGLAWALARAWQMAPAHSHTATPLSPQINGTEHPPTAPLLVTASRHPVLRHQLKTLATLGTPRVVLADLSGPQPLTAGEAHQALTQQARELVASQPRPSHVVVVGGDTLLALCRAAGVQHLGASASPREGWGRARMHGGAWDGCVCYSRSGAFGEPDDLVALLETTLEKEPAP